MSCVEMELYIFEFFFLAIFSQNSRFPIATTTTNKYNFPIRRMGYNFFEIFFQVCWNVQIIFELVYISLRMFYLNCLR